VRLLAVLRQPVERAYSSYLMHTRNGGERRAFAEAVREELDGSANPRLPYGQLHYVRLGFYHQLLSPYWERFPRPRLHVELYDDLRDDPQAFLRRVYSFLDVDENFRPDTSVRVNASGIPRRRIFAPLLRKNRVNLLVRALLPRALEVRAGKAYERWRASQLVQPPLDPALRADLIALYRDDIVALGRAIDRDLKRWLE
jgi:hypothetical protein